MVNDKWDRKFREVRKGKNRKVRIRGEEIESVRDERNV